MSIPLTAEVTSVGGAVAAAPAAVRPLRFRRPAGPATAARMPSLATRVGRAALEMPASTWMVLDALLIAGALQLGYSIFGVSATYGGVAHLANWQAYAVFVGAFMFASLVFGLYERETLWSRARIVVRILLTSAVALVVAYALIYVVMYSNASRRAVGCALLMYLAAGLGLRLAAWRLIHRVRRPLLVVGSAALYDSFLKAQEHGFLSEYQLVGYTSDQASGADRDDRCLGHSRDLDRIRAGLHVTDMVVGAEAGRSPDVMTWVTPSLRAGCRVTNEATFYEKATGQILVDELTPQWFLYADLAVADDDRVNLKRIVDILASLVGLGLTLPLWPILGLVIKLGDGGSVLYSQDRVGLKGRLFRLVKFRTMRPDAENGVSVWASPNDPRVTPAGRILRRTRLDELPQLLNILMGHMSIVGPRPERPDIVRRLGEQIPYYNERHLAKPGLTGWAQINYPYGATIEDAKRKLQFDLYYLKHACFELDMMILFRTLGTFLRGGR